MLTPDSRPFPCSQRGFTLGEVLATLGVLGVSLSLVVPGMSSVTRDNLRAGAINDLVATMHTARAEALTRNRSVTVCPSSNGTDCSAVAWDAGWIRFEDNNDNYRVDAGEAVLGNAAPLAGLRIHTDAFRTALSYGPSGRLTSPDRREPGGEFTFCPVNSSGGGRIVAVSALGLPVLSAQAPDGQAPDCSTG